MKLPMTYITLGTTKIEKSKFRLVQNKTMSCKPYGGLWASPYNKTTEYVSDWDRWCDEEQFSTGDNTIGVIFELKEESNIIVIDGLKDLGCLLDKFSQEDVIINGHKINIFGGRYLNYEHLSRCADGILLTHKGQIQTRMTVDNLYGWDCESLLLFNLDCIKFQREWRK